MKTIKELGKYMKDNNLFSTWMPGYTMALKDVVGLIDECKEQFYPNKFEALTEFVKYLKERIEG